MKRLSGSHGDDRFGYCAPHLLKPPLTLPDDDLAGLNRRFARIEVCLTHFEVGRDRLGCLLRSLCVLEDLLRVLSRSGCAAPELCQGVEERGRTGSEGHRGVVEKHPGYLDLPNSSPVAESFSIEYPLTH